MDLGSSHKLGPSRKTQSVPCSHDPWRLLRGSPGPRKRTFAEPTAGECSQSYQYYAESKECQKEDEVDSLNVKHGFLFCYGFSNSQLRRLKYGKHAEFSYESVGEYNNNDILFNSIFLPTLKSKGRSRLFYPAARCVADIQLRVFLSLSYAR